MKTIIKVATTYYLTGMILAVTSAILIAGGSPDYELRKSCGIAFAIWVAGGIFTIPLITSVLWDRER